MAGRLSWGWLTFRKIVNLVGCSFILLGDYDVINSEAHY